VRKVIVCGPYNAGKTSFIKNVNPEEFVGTEENEIDIESLEALPTTTTVGVEINSVKIKGKEIVFIGLPGQEKFDFIWETVGSKFDGILFLVPSTATLRDASLYIDFFSQFESFKIAFKRLLVTYPERLTPSKKETFSLLGVPIKVIDPTQEEEVKNFLEELSGEI